MAKKQRTRGRGQLGTVNQQRNFGMRAIPQTEDAKKTRSINVLQGVIPLELQQTPMTGPSKETPMATPIATQSITQATKQQDNSNQAQSSGKQSWADKVEKKEELIGKSQALASNLTSWSKIVGNTPVTEGFDLEGVNSNANVKITMEDIKEEIEYWQTAVVCFVLGSNPPLTVVEGYFNRIWKDLGIDKVAQINKRVFMVRFHSNERRTKAIEGGVQIFDRKPVIIKPWKPGMEIMNVIVEQVPIWIRLVGLDLKYWGQAALAKIAGLVGKPVKADTTTTRKKKLMYARVMVEVPFNKAYPDSVMFENELGQIIEQKI